MEQPSHQLFWVCVCLYLSPWCGERRFLPNLPAFLEKLFTEKTRMEVSVRQKCLVLLSQPAEGFKPHYSVWGEEGQRVGSLPYTRHLAVARRLPDSLVCC